MILSQAILKFQNRGNFLKILKKKKKKILKVAKKKSKTKQKTNKQTKTKTKTKKKTKKMDHISQNREEITIRLFKSNTETQDTAVHAFRG